MKLNFDTYKKGKFFGVNIWVRSKQSSLFDDWGDEPIARDYLEESQYNQIAKWCAQTFNTKENPKRARRMAFADFWFASQRDLDWFILHWSGVDSDSF